MSFFKVSDLQLKLTQVSVHTHICHSVLPFIEGEQLNYVP